jgi:hypothetical protein
MADALSRFDVDVAAAFQATADRIEAQLVSQGVDGTRARGFIEQQVSFFRVPGDLDLKVSAECGKLATRGASDNSIIWFSRQLLLDHPELGGKAVPFGNEMAPEADWEVEAKAKTQAEVKRIAKAERDKLIESHERELEALRQRAAAANLI